MDKLDWYFHRLRAMGPGEILLRGRKWVREWFDSCGSPASVELSSVTRDFPRLPDREAAQDDFKKDLRRDVGEILAGRWRAFGRLPIQVDDPPRWHCDYLADVDLPTSEVAFRLNHRHLPRGADIKLVWELSRWQQLTRLALAAYFLNDARASAKCVEWLDDWVRENPPYRGWNWTSALESGMRLIQFVWIDALLSKCAGSEIEHALKRLRKALLVPHVRYTWRHRSFGSSANNHLLGELSGLLAVLARWPGLAVHCTSFDELQGFWEKETLDQFAPDGGNREQALNYHLFAWEFCLIAWSSILSIDSVTSARVEERLVKAAEFFVSVDRGFEQWGYGDSDDATVLPLWSDAGGAVLEWRRWMANSQSAPALGMWWNGFRRPGQIPRVIVPIEETLRGVHQREDDWCMLSNTGIAVKKSGDWFMRFDLSPLGYGPMAAHGHLDALHLSIWWQGKAVVIDPGTGAYYGDPEIRDWLASRAAHNGPCLGEHDPATRHGLFLWSGPHSVPAWRQTERNRLRAEWFLPAGTVHRGIEELENHSGWRVIDDFLPHGPGVRGEFKVRWQFAPGTDLRRIQDRRFRIERSGMVIHVEMSKDWDTVVAEGVEDAVEEEDMADRHPRAGQVSPSFRTVRNAPALLLAASAGHKPCVFSTTFLASAAP
jgi:hypothetical protein